MPRALCIHTTLSKPLHKLSITQTTLTPGVILVHVTYDISPGDAGVSLMNANSRVLSRPLAVMFGQSPSHCARVIASHSAHPETINSPQETTSLAQHKRHSRVPRPEDGDTGRKPCGRADEYKWQDESVAVINGWPQYRRDSELSC